MEIDSVNETSDRRRFSVGITNDDDRQYSAFKKRS